MNEKKVGNIGEKEYAKCVEYFQIYWGYFTERHPDINTPEWMDVYFAVFLSGFSAGIIVGEENKTTLMERIIKSN